MMVSGAHSLFTKYAVDTGFMQSEGPVPQPQLIKIGDKRKTAGENHPLLFR
jgi:hypothetical protein